MRRVKCAKICCFVAYLITSDIFHQEGLKADMTNFLCWPVLFQTMIPKEKRFDKYECCG